MYLRDCAKYQALGERARDLIRKRGFTSQGYKVWDAEEDDTCRALHPDFKALLKALPHRSLDGIRKRCSELGITKQRDWTAKRHSLFQKLYRSGSMAELRAAFPGMTDHAIFERGSRYGLVRPSKPLYSTTGNALFDELRRECFRRRITMADLDEFAGSGKYFHRRHWKGTRINYNHIVRAIREIGGTITVEWEKLQ